MPAGLQQGTELQATHRGPTCAGQKLLEGPPPPGEPMLTRVSLTSCPKRPMEHQLQEGGGRGAGGRGPPEHGRRGLEQGRGPGTTQTSAPPVTGQPRLRSPRPLGTAHTPRPESHGSLRRPESQSHPMSRTEGGAPRPHSAASAQAHHLGAEAAVGELPHEGQLAGFRPAQQVLSDALHGFEVVFQ